MARKDYLPTDTGGKILWLTNFVAKLAVHGAALGVTPAKQTALSTRLNNFQTAVDAAEAAKTTYHSKVADARISQRVVISDLGGARSIVNEIQESPALTDIIEQDLGIIALEGELDPNVLVPIIKNLLATGEGWVLVNFLKGKAERINIYCKRGNETEFTLIGTDGETPYLDSRENLTDAPETREYKIRIVINDVEVGQFSAVVSIVV
ncbi:MAG: hypothetical protein IPJ03_18490 [Ignavibacteriales bacterium]|nr:hypothetical protein [Ignavibacteriales bacterium]